MSGIRLRTISRAILLTFLASWLGGQQPTKEYIRLGSKVIAVENPPPPPVVLVPPVATLGSLDTLIFNVSASNCVANCTPVWGTDDPTVATIAPVFGNPNSAVLTPVLWPATVHVTATVGGVVSNSATVQLKPVLDIVSFSFPSGGGQGSVIVTKAGNWTAHPDAGWIHFNSPQPDVNGDIAANGNQTVTFLVDPNTTLPPQTRASTITFFGNNQINVSVAAPGGGGPPGLAAQPSGITVSAAGGTAGFHVESVNGAHWMVQESTLPGWIHFADVTVFNDHTSSADLTFTFDGNPSASQRSGDICLVTDCSVKVHVVQDVGVTINPLGATLNSSDQVGNVQVIAPAGTDWSSNVPASCQCPWLTITGGNSGSGGPNGSSTILNYHVTGNNPGGVRSGTLNIGGKTFTVTQSGTAGVVISPQNWSMGAPAFQQFNAYLNGSSTPASNGVNWSLDANHVGQLNASGGYNSPPSLIGSHTDIITAAAPGIGSAAANVALYYGAGGGGVSLNPSNSNNTSINYADFILTIPTGGGSLTNWATTTMLFTANPGAPWPAGDNSCVVLFLYNGTQFRVQLNGDNGTSAVGNAPITPSFSPGANPYANSQCELDVARTTGQIVTGQIIYRTSILFRPAWSGNKGIYIRSENDQGQPSIQPAQFGNWTSPGFSAPGVGFATTPAANATVSGTVNLTGWALDWALDGGAVSTQGNPETPISLVEVFVDGVKKGNATRGQSPPSNAPTVCSAFPNQASVQPPSWDCPNFGWTFAWDTAGLLTGSHVVRVVATDSDPTPRTSFIERTFNVVAAVATPTFSPVGGVYSTPQSVVISTTTAGATIRYTLDGTTPTASSAIFSTPLTISGPTVLKAIAFKSGLPDSSIGTASYTITSWYSTAWSGRKALTVNHTKVVGPSNLANFPMLFSVTDPNLKTVANGGSVGKSDGTDILFTAADGATVLNHELEYYNPVTGQTVAWVQIPTLSPNTDTVVYVYYGNAAAADQQHVSAVWDSNYQLVWHLKNGTTLSAADSTSNVTNGSISGATAGSSQIGGGAVFSPNSYLGVTVNVSEAAFTASGWFKTSTLNTGLWQVDGNDRGASGFDRLLYVDSSGNLCARTWNNETICTTGVNYANNVWHYVTHEVGPGGHKIFVDGQQKASGAKSTSDFTWQTGMTIGFTNDAGYFAGALDEMRVSNIIRSSDWIGTEYNNQNLPGTFYAVGTPESQGGGGTVAAPTFNPVAGTYASSQSVTISTTTSGASIRYTLDGSTPTSTVGTPYSTPVSISSTTTLKAIAYKSGLTSSAVNSATYTISTSQPIAIFNTGLTSSGTLAADASVDAHYTLFSSADPSYPGPNALVTNSSWPVASGVWVYPNGPSSKWISPRADQATPNYNTQGDYTYRTTFDLTGLDPSTASLSGWGAADNSAVVKLNGVQLATIGGFGSPTNFSLNSSFVSGVNTLDFIVNNAGSSGSPTGLRVEVSGTANSVGQVATPTFNPAAGTYTSSQSVTISTTTSGASIRYTLDGSTPTATVGAVYSTPVSISSTTTLKAIAYKSGMSNSAVASATYTITGGGPAWYNASWTNRKALTIDHTKVSGSSALTNFPVLISRTSDSDLSANAQSNGNDILFTASDGTTKLSHEIEGYVSGTGAISAWVKIPVLSTSADTVVYMYYGNSSAADQQNKTGVWDSNYKGVWHLKESTASIAAPGGTIFDSTVNALNLTTQQAITSNQPSQQAGQVANGILFPDRFDPFGGTYATSNDVVTGAGTVPNLTVEAWIKFPAFHASDGNDSFVGTRSYTNACHNVFGLLQSAAGNGVGVRIYNNCAAGLDTSVTTVSLDTWYHLVGTYDGTNLKLYSNGVLAATATGTVTWSADSPIALAVNSRYHHAIYDEFRLSNVTRSAAWITTEYNNQSSPSTFFAVGNQENGGGGGTVATPTFNPAAGTYTTTQSVTLSTTTSGASIYYTVDGSTPTTSSTLYSSAISVSNTTTIKAIGHKSGMTDSAVASAPYTINSNWYSTGGTWTHRKALTIDHTKVSGSTALTNFPVLVSVTDSNLQASAQSNGNDILFTASDGVTKLPHEIESYTSSNGNLIAWVQVPSVSSTTDTVIYVYYGNAAAADQQNKPGVWDSNFKGVWHMNDTGGPATDSTTNAKNAAIMNGAPTFGVAGQIANSVSFNGTSDVLRATSVGLGGATAATWSGWINWADFTNDNMLAALGSTTFTIEGNNGGGYTNWNPALIVRLNINQENCKYAPAPSTNAWHHVVLVMDPSQSIDNEIKLYVDGAAQTLTTYGNCGVGDNTGTFPAQDLHFGGWAYSWFYGKGKLNEVRLSSSTRSASWITTEFNNQNSPATFYSVGAQQ